MYGKEKEFTSFDSQGPTDFDIVGFHSDTIEDILKLIDLLQILKIQQIFVAFLLIF